MWRMSICRLSLHIFVVLICTVTSHNHKNIPLSYGDYLSQYHPHQVEKRNHHVREKKYVDNLKKFHELEQSLNEETNLHFYIRHNHFLDWFDEELSGLFHTIPHPTTTADQESASTSDAQKVLEDIKDEIRRGRNMTKGDLRRSRSRSNSNNQRNKRRMNINSEYNEQINWASTLNPLGSNILTPIQNQGACGACWAFAAAEATAASLRINGYPQVTLSAQELLDCDSGFNSGCSGGNPAMAYLYIMEHGITTALSLPYQGYEQQCYRNDIALPDSDDPSTSTTTTTTSSLTSSSLISSSISSVSHSQNHFQKQKLQSSPSILISEKSLASASSSPTPVATISKFVILPSRNEFFLKEYVNTVGPVSVGICGTDPYFLYYGGGIFNTPDCCTELNHAVVIVGYGTDEDTGLDYWIAQNSWGERWGENGFIRLARSTSFFSLGQCGIAIGSSIPIGAHLLVPESEVLNPQPPNWEEWIDQLERWSLSNIQDIIYGFSALMVLISVSLFCCGLMIDIFTYVNGASPPAPPLLPSHPHPRIEQSNGAQVGGGPSVGSKYNSTSRSSALQAAPLPSSSSSSSSYYQSENYQNNGV